MTMAVRTVAAAATTLLMAVRLEQLELDSTNNSMKKEIAVVAGKDEIFGRSRRNPPLFLTKPSWVVRTESNVRKKIRKKPDPPCEVCHGTGRVDCFHCSGKGRTNCVHFAMLPKGEWPKWCRTCGGSGLGYCSRCLGTGECRYIMGFQFMKMASEDTKNHPQQHQTSPQNTADRLLNREQVDSNHDIRRFSG